MNQEKETLRKRELELQRLMRQMKFDELQKSKVYQNLEQELLDIQNHLVTEEPFKKEGWNWKAWKTRIFRPATLKVRVFSRCGQDYENH